VALINYIRNKILSKECIYCEEYFSTEVQLENHLNEFNHCKFKSINVKDLMNDSRYLEQILPGDLLITEIPSDDDNPEFLIEYQEKEFQNKI